MSADLQEQKAGAEEPKKPSREILRDELTEATEALERPAVGLFLSGLSAGLDIGFSLFVMGVIWTLFEGTASPGLLKVLLANAYAVGFLFVVLGRSELFTEQTTLAVLPVLDGRASVGALLRLWAIVYLANLIGGAVFAAMATVVGPATGAIEPRAFGAIAATLTAHAAPAAFAAAVLAGWLMGLLSWLVAAGRDTISQVALIWLIAAVIGLCGLPHVVLGSVEVLAGVFAGQGVTPADYGQFLLWTTLGNVVGGGVFVALIKYSHVVRTQPHSGPEGGERNSFHG